VPLEALCLACGSQGVQAAYLVRSDHVQDLVLGARFLKTLCIPDLKRLGYEVALETGRIETQAVFDRPDI
jgi:hypothetical protein